jgi:hypothetical protein
MTVNGLIDKELQTAAALRLRKLTYAALRDLMTAIYITETPKKDAVADFQAHIITGFALYRALAGAKNAKLGKAQPLNSIDDLKDPDEIAALKKAFALALADSIDDIVIKAPELTDGDTTNRWKNGCATLSGAADVAAAALNFKPDEF